MGNRVGIILHNNWMDFSPLLYSHNGAECRVWQLQQYLREYKSKHDVLNNDGHIYNPEHMMVGFIQSFDPDIHTRVECLSDSQIFNLQGERDYPNCFDGGCWIVNVNPEHYGETDGDYSERYRGNIVQNELEEDFE